MFITITIESGGAYADIRIDSEQHIGMGLKVLRESGVMPFGDVPDYYRSGLSEKIVSAYKTFHDEGIFDGDVLSGV